MKFHEIKKLSIFLQKVCQSYSTGQIFANPENVLIQKQKQIPWRILTLDYTLAVVLHALLNEQTLFPLKITISTRDNKQGNLISLIQTYDEGSRTDFSEVKWMPHRNQEKRLISCLTHFRPLLPLYRNQSLVSLWLKQSS